MEYNVLKMKVKKKFILLLLLCGIVAAARGQNFAVKTNLFSDAAANANLGLEFGLAPRWSFDLTGDYNQWTIKDRKWKHWVVQPEARYWFCDHFAKHFLALHAVGGQFNVGNIKNGISFLGSDFSQLSDHRFQGWGVGAGLGYGYAFMLSRHLNLEMELGFGYVYLNYDRFECKNCGKKVGSDTHHYVGPTKAAVNLVYVF